LQVGPSENIESPMAFTYGYPVVAMGVLYLIVLFSGEAISAKKWQPDMEAAIKNIAEPFEARTYVNTEGDTLKYRLLKPLRFDPSKQYPIMVCLHGSSGTGNDNYRQVAASMFPEFLTHGSNREKYQAFIFVPQCPFGTSWGGVHPLPGIDQLVFDAMASLETEFPIDPKRRYVGGGSLGGYGTWHFIESHPETFAAAIPFCGVGNPSLASKCADVPVWAFHGANDSRVPVSGSRDMINAMKAAGGNPRYTEYPDKGHDIGKLVSEEPGLLDWLFAQRRGEIQ
jgi:predicted peptidase